MKLLTTKYESSRTTMKLQSESKGAIQLEARIHNKAGWYFQVRVKIIR